MKFLLVLSVLTSLSSFAQVHNKSIYGEDNRKDIHEVTNPSYLKLAQSTAAMINKSFLEVGETSVVIRSLNLSFTQLTCDDVRFSDQITAADCSGFLVADDVIATAGHCVKTIKDCEDAHWVFGFELNKDSKPETSSKYIVKMEIPSADVYSCKNIIVQKLDDRKKLDYALIRLDRKVVGREPLKIRTDGKVKKKMPLVVIGNPSGLPTKIADNATVKSVDKTVFFSNLDAFGGNSGSAVFNTETEEVEGILVAGRKDYNIDYDRKCKYPTKYVQEDGSEKATKITAIPELKELLSR